MGCASICENCKIEMDMSLQFENRAWHFARFDKCANAQVKTIFHYAVPKLRKNNYMEEIYYYTPFRTRVQNQE